MSARKKNANSDSNEQLPISFDGNEVLDIIDEGVAILDKTGKILYANERIYNISRYAKADILGKRFKFLDIFFARDVPKLLLNFSKTILGKKVHPIKVTIKAKDERILQVSILSTLFDHPKYGKLVISLFRDISNPGRDNLVQLGDDSDSPVVIVNSDSDILYHNHSFSSLLGFDNYQELTGNSLTSYVYNKNKPPSQEAIDSLLNSKDESIKNISIKDKQGKSIEAKVTLKQFDYLGHKATILSIISNSKVVDHSKDLKSSKVRDNLMLNNAEDIILLVDKEGIILDVNKKALTILGYKSEYFIGKTIDNLIEVFPSDSILRLTDSNPVSLKGAKETKKFSISAKHKGGDSIEFDVYPSFIYNNDGTVLATVFSLHHINEKTHNSRNSNPEILAQKYLDIVNVIILSLDLDGNIIRINNYGSKKLEGEKEKIIGKNWFETFIPAEEKRKVINVFSSLKNSKDTGKYKEVKNTVITLKNNLLNMQWNNSVVRDANGEVIEISTSGHDITIEEQYKKSMDLQRSVLEIVTFATEQYLRGQDIESSLQVILSKIQKNLDCPSIVLYELDNKSSTLKAKYISCKSGTDIKSCKLPENITINNNAIKSLLPVNKISITLKKEDAEMLTKQKDLHSINIMQIKVRTDLWGFLFASRNDKFIDTKEINQVLEITASLVGAIIEKRLNENKLKHHSKRLEKLNQLMIGRELKMIELKKKIRKLSNHKKQLKQK